MSDSSLKPEIYYISSTKDSLEDVLRKLHQQYAPGIEPPIILQELSESFHQWASASGNSIKFLRYNRSFPQERLSMMVNVILGAKEKQDTRLVDIRFVDIEA